MMLMPDNEWCDTQEAARVLAVHPNTVHKMVRADTSPPVDRRIRSARATTAKGCGYLWLRADLERLMRIRRECRITLSQAMKIIGWLKREERQRNHP